LTGGMTSARVSIGLATYNRPEFLRSALECFRRQTLTDFELIISDNASPNPEVQRLCEWFAREDSRFRYVRQPVNQGAVKNFWFVYDHARSPLFLWASDDDLWPVDFLEKGVVALEAKPELSAWFCEVVNINNNGEIARTYPSNRRFQSTRWKSIDLARFLWEPEILGKASLFYSIFRRPSIGPMVELFRERSTPWGLDMNMVYGVLCRSNVVIDSCVVMQKRLPTSSLAGAGKNLRAEIYPREERVTYFRNYRLAAAGSGYWLLTAAVLAARSLYDYLYSGIARQDYKNWPPRRRIVRVLRWAWARFPGSRAAG
jgi:glycosyltransferase involved in cell wall biosynthesis